MGVEHWGGWLSVGVGGGVCFLKGNVLWCTWVVVGGGCLERSVYV
jgi:hypothetical protein